MLPLLLKPAFETGTFELQAETGIAVRTKQITPDAYLNSFYGPNDRAAFRHQYDVFRAIGLWYSQYDFIGNSNVLTWLLERPPTTLRAFIAREWHLYTGREKAS